MDRSTVFLESLQADLKSISTEAKKKFLPIKEAADRASVQLRSLDEQKLPLEKYSELIGETDEVLSTFLLAWETKNLKLVTIAIGGIHKLIVLKAISKQSVDKLMGKLSTTVFLADEHTQLKILQSLVALATAIEIHDKQLSEIFSICFKLQGNKHPIAVQNTAAAAVRQLLTMLFDRLFVEHNNRDTSKQETDIQPSSSAEKKSTSRSTSPQPSLATPQKSSSASISLNASGDFTSPRKSGGLPDPTSLNLTPSGLDGYYLINDICCLTGGDSASWMDLDHFSKNFGLELVESILSTHSHVFADIPVFRLLLKDRICPVVIKTFRLSVDFPSVLRLTRIMAVFIKHFNNLLVTECEVFISRLTKMLDSHNPLWVQTIALETFKGVCENTDIVRSIYRHYDFEHEHKSAKIFHHIVSSLGQFVQGMYTWDNSLIARNPGMKIKYLDSLSISDPPATINEVHVVSVAVDCLIGVVNAIAKITNTKDQERIMGSEMANFSWPTLLGSLTMLLEKSNDEVLIEDILRSTVSFIYTCGSLGLSTPRDTFLTSLCKYTLPKQIQPGDLASETGLTSKNILCMKTLFQIAHNMGDVLDSGWFLVLETFQHLDRILNTPHRVAQQDSTAPIQSTSDLNTLVSFLDSLFKTSHNLNDNSLRQLFSGLRKVSSDSIKTGKQRPLFGASKMVETAHHNIQRITKFWDIVIDHLLELTASKDQSIRTFAIDSLSSLISTALLMKNHNAADPNTPLTMQENFIATLEKLSQSTFVEAQEKSLLTLYNVLQSSGQVLTTGWPLVLAILKLIAAVGDKHLVSIAFKSVQLICTDFLPYLPFGCLSVYIRTVGSFGEQKADLNIALTAINLLWNVSDFLAQESAKLIEKFKAVNSGSKAESTSDTVVGKELTESQTNIANTSPSETESISIDILWLNLFSEVKELGADPRYEVRNCAAQTLSKILTTHGGAQTLNTWETCFNKIIFPLIKEVRTGASLASTDELSKGNTKLLVHHSRNTDSKQWSETLVLTISGLLRVVKTFYGTLSELSIFPKIWENLFDEIYECSLYPSVEVSVTTIQSAVDMLIAQSQGQTIDRSLWNVSWKALERITIAITRKGKGEIITTINSLIKSLNRLYTVLQPLFNNDDMIRFLRIVRPLALFPPDVENDISFIQKEVLSLIHMIPPSEDVFPYLINEYLVYLSFVIGFPYEPSFLTNPADDISFLKSCKLDTLYLPLAIKALQELNQRFNESSTSMRCLVFADIVRVLGAAMMTKYSAYQSQFWRDSVEVFIKVVQIGLPEINSANTLSDIELNILWTELADCVEGFLFSKERDKLPFISQEVAKRDDNIDISLVDLLARDMLCRCNRVPKLHERMIEIILDGTQLAPANSREAFAVGCYKNLFFLCGNGGLTDNDYSCHTKIAQMVFPILIRKCKDVLQKFISEEKKSGTLPTARGRLAEVSFVLQQLKMLELAPSIDITIDAPSDLPTQTLKSTGKKRHLLKLFPLLCDCITTRENSVKEILKDLFHEAAKEIGLE